MNALGKWMTCVISATALCGCDLLVTNSGTEDMGANNGDNSSNNDMSMNADMGTNSTTPANSTTTNATTPTNGNTGGPERIGVTTFDGSPSKYDWGGGTTVAKLEMGERHGCALFDQGGLKCWGSNSDKMMLGISNTSAFSPMPNLVPSKGSGVVDVYAGPRFTCALLDDDTVECWGNNIVGQLGRATPGESYTPLNVPLLEEGIAGISGGAGFACVWYESGGATCWGVNGGGELGRGETGSVSGEELPAAVENLDEKVLALEGGDRMTCAITETNALKCWGDGGRIPETNVPVVIEGLESGVTALSVRGGSYCVVQNAKVYCAGDNTNGQLGNGTDTYEDSYVEMLGLPGDAVDVAVGGSHACALLDSGEVWCTGDNDEGQLGRGMTSQEESLAAAVVGLEGKAVEISAGGEHTCARLENNKVQCWGYNLSGQLADGTNTDRSEATMTIGLTR